MPALTSSGLSLQRFVAARARREGEARRARPVRWARCRPTVRGVHDLEITVVVVEVPRVTRRLAKARPEGAAPGGDGGAMNLCAGPPDYPLVVLPCKSRIFMQRPLRSSVTASPALPTRCMCARDIEHHAKHAQEPWDST